MLESLPRSQRQLAFGIMTALLLGAVVATVLVVGQLKDHQVTPATKAKQVPVIVLPGYGGRLTSLIPIVAALRAEGREAVVFTPTAHESGDLRIQAQLLGAVVTRTLRTSHAKSVDVVGYSAGGIIARLWVRDYGGAPLARRVLTISSPHHGTSRAIIEAETAGNGCPAACVQLSDGSDFLRQLNAGDETPAGPTWITIRSSSDAVVVPTSSAILKGALNLSVQDGCPGATTTHTGMPADPYVLSALGSTLGLGTARAPTSVPC